LLQNQNVLGYLTKFLSLRRSGEHEAGQRFGIHLEELKNEFYLIRLTNHHSRNFASSYGSYEHFIELQKIWREQRPQYSNLTQITTGRKYDHSKFITNHRDSTWPQFLTNFQYKISSNKITSKTNFQFYLMSLLGFIWGEKFYCFLLHQKQLCQSISVITYRTVQPQWNNLTHFSVSPNGTWNLSKIINTFCNYLKNVKNSDKKNCL